MWGQPVARVVFARGDVAEGAGAVSDHKTQVRLSPKRRCDLSREIVHYIQKGSVWLGLVRDQRSTEFEEDEFFHASIVIIKT